MSRELFFIARVFKSGAGHGFVYVPAREILLRTGTAFHETSPILGLRLPA